MKDELTDEYFLEMLNNINNDLQDFCGEDLLDLILWMQDKHNSFKTEYVIELSEIGINAIKLSQQMI